VYDLLGEKKLGHYLEEYAANNDEDRLPPEDMLLNCLITA
jgi:hypothetical protein